MILLRYADTVRPPSHCFIQSMPEKTNEEGQDKNGKERKDREIVHDIDKKCKKSKEQNDDTWKNNNEEIEQNRTEDGRIINDDKYTEEKGTNGEESENTEHIRDRIGFLENYLEKEHETMAALLVKIGLKAVQQWSWDMTEAEVKKF